MQTRIAEMTPKIAQLEKQLGIEPSGAAKAATKLLDEQKPLPKPAEEEKPPSAALTAALESLSKLTQQALDKSKETRAERTISRYRIRGGWCRRRHQRRSQHNPPIDLAAPLVSASRHRDHDRCSNGSPRARLLVPAGIGECELRGGLRHRCRISHRRRSEHHHRRGHGR